MKSTLDTKDTCYFFVLCSLPTARLCKLSLYQAGSFMFEFGPISSLFGPSYSFSVHRGAGSSWQLPAGHTSIRKNSGMSKIWSASTPVSQFTAWFFWTPALFFIIRKLFRIYRTCAVYFTLVNSDDVVHIHPSIHFQYQWSPTCFLPRTASTNTLLSWTGSHEKKCICTAQFWGSLIRPCQIQIAFK